MTTFGKSISLAGASSQPVPAGEPASWDYISGRETVGPITWPELQSLARLRTIWPATRVFDRQLQRWDRASDIPGLFQRDYYALQMAHERFASPERRLAGSLIDGIVLLLLEVIVLYFYAQFKGSGSLTLVELAGLFGIHWMIFLAVNGWLLVKQGQTFGKLIAGTRIVGLDGRVRSIFWLLLVRYVPFFGSVWLAGLLHPVVGAMVLLLDVGFILCHDRRCAHDLVAGTCVIRAELPKEGRQNLPRGTPGPSGAQGERSVLRVESKSADGAATSEMDPSSPETVTVARDAACDAAQLPQITDIGSDHSAPQGSPADTSSGPFCEGAAIESPVERDKAIVDAELVEPMPENSPAALEDQASASELPAIRVVGESVGHAHRRRDSSDRLVTKLGLVICCIALCSWFVPAAGFNMLFGGPHIAALLLGLLLTAFVILFDVPAEAIWGKRNRRSETDSRRKI